MSVSYEVDTSSDRRGNTDPSHRLNLIEADKEFDNLTKSTTRNTLVPHKHQGLFLLCMYLTMIPAILFCVTIVPERLYIADAAPGFASFSVGFLSVSSNQTLDSVNLLDACNAGNTVTPETENTLIWIKSSRSCNQMRSATALIIAATILSFSCIMLFLGGTLTSPVPRAPEVVRGFWGHCKRSFCLSRSSFILLTIASAFVAVASGLGCILLVTDFFDNASINHSSFHRAFLYHVVYVGVIMQFVVAVALIMLRMRDKWPYINVSIPTETY